MKKFMQKDLSVSLEDQIDVTAIKDRPEDGIQIDQPIGGLNAGFELDDEPLTAVDLFQNPQPNEIPELKDDIEMIVAIEHRLDDLLYLSAGIESAGGMSREFAIQAKRIMGDEFTIPENYFTEAATRTQYQPSMESISETVRNWLAKAIAKLKQMVARFMNWLLGKNSKDVTEENAESIAAEAKNIGQIGHTRVGAIRNVRQEMHNLEGVFSDFLVTMHNNPFEYVGKDHRPVKYTTILKLLSDTSADGQVPPVVTDLMGSQDKVFAAMANTTEVSKAIHHLREISKAHRSGVVMRLGLLRDLLAAVANNDSEKAKSLAAQIEKKIVVPGGDETVAEQYIDNWSGLAGLPPSEKDRSIGEFYPVLSKFLDLGIEQAISDTFDGVVLLAEINDLRAGTDNNQDNSEAAAAAKKSVGIVAHEVGVYLKLSTKILSLMTEFAYTTNRVGNVVTHVMEIARRQAAQGPTAGWNENNGGGAKLTELYSKHTDVRKALVGNLRKALK